ncbi:MAG: hypothetical protein P0Y66_22330 [Candidatus Kaistia colombiensis]|nr:MAG: hypothetical protein P0Y66_22330 [Kaistia sp.]
MTDAPIEDITIRLAFAALDPESVEPAEMESLLREAIQTIELLRMLVGIREDIELENIEPEGNA